MAEIIIVIGLIGILAASLVIVINPAKQLSRARDDRRRTELEQIRSALELYRSDCGFYPKLRQNLSGQLSASCNGGTVIYMQEIPVDPQTGVGYWYNAVDGFSGVSSGEAYLMSACAENTDSPGSQNAGTFCAPTYKMFYVTSP